MKIQLVMGGVDKSGGAERVMCVLANTFADLGHDTILSVLSVDTKPFYPLNDKVRYIQSGKVINIPIVRYLHKLVRLRKVMKREKADAIISFITPMNCATILVSSGLKRKVFVSERIVPSHYDGTKIGRLRSLLYPHATGVVCQTTEAKEYFRYKKCYNRCSVIKNPITTHIAPKIDYSSNGRICAVGRLTEQKNYPLMLAAFKEFVTLYQEYSLDIFGDGELKETLQQQINDLQLTDKVILMGSVSDLGDRLRDYDMFIMTSDYEGMSNALAEAMAAGLPCVSTNCAGGGAADLINDGIDGFLVPIKNKNLLVNKMQDLAAKEELRKQIGTAAANIKNDLSAEKIAEEWISLVK